MRSALVGSVSDHRAENGTIKCPESLWQRSVLPASGRRVRLLRGHYSPVIALTDSCADPVDSPLLRPKPRSRSLCRLLPAPATGGTIPTIGIERRRASRRWRVSVLALSVCKAGSQFHLSYVSRGPPIIPDGRISQVRLEVLAYRQ
jgi:hypothetical protein